MSNRTRTTTIRATIAVAALALTGAACGGGDDGGGGEGAADTDNALVQALADDIMTDVDAGDSPVANRDEAECWASGVVGGIGEDRLNELGLTVDNIVDPDELDLSPEEVDVVVSSLFDCADVQQAFAEQFAADFGEEGANCIAEGLDEALVREALTASIAGDDAQPSAEFIEKFTQLATDCGIGG